MNPNSQSYLPSISNLPTSGPTGLAAGSVLGTYTLTEPLGRGGMGQVWKATDGKRPVAIKLLPPEFRGNTAAMAQVGEAFQIVHALTHEHICKTLGLFDDRVHGPYLVLDFIPGITLSEYQRTGGFPQKQLPVELVAEILRPVARALDYSHRKVIQLPSGEEHEGVLHRDVKPDNILIVQREGRIHEVWLIDFGLAAEIRNTMTKHTNSSVDTRGTRPYMSPEQIKGKRHQWDARTDQYSLAVVAYQLLSGHLPFDGDDDFSLMLAITQEAADPIPGLPEHVNAAVLKGLAKAKEVRFGSCLEFVDALAANPRPRVIVPKPEASALGKSRVVALRALTLPAQPSIADIPKLVDTKEITLPTGVKHKLIWCPPGTFLMGTPGATNNERPVNVTLTSGFWLGQTVVTQAMWTAVMETTPWIERGDESRYKTGTDYPAVYINHLDATAFCDKLTKIERAAGRLPTGWKYALPTEAQWEYACRAGTTNVYSYGADDGRLGQYAWYTKNADDIGEKYAHAAGTKKPNPWGLSDMHGNVWEWCVDWYGDKLVGGTNPAGPSTGSNRVSRGGGWSNSAGSCRSAFRIRDDPSFRSRNLGFRVCLSSDMVSTPVPQMPENDTPSMSLDVADNAKEVAFPKLSIGAGKIDENAAKTFTTTESGLKYRILRAGSDVKPKARQTVEVNYHGWLDNEKVFDSSYKRGESISFSLNQVIAGWTEGMQLVGKGGMIELEIPAKLGYGARGAGADVPPNATLHFLVELIDIK